MGTKIVSGKRKDGAVNSLSKKRMTVYGYVRTNFGEKHCVNEVTKIIFQFYVVKGGSLYMFGNGKNGCLGIKKYENKICKKPTVCPPFNDMNVLDVSADHHTLILDVYGDVWGCGIVKEKNTSTPQKLKLMQPAIAVAVGGYHSLILLKNGNVQSFGWANGGRLGHGNGNDLSSAFVKTIEALQHIKVIKIAAGGSHSACLTENGNLFCFGHNLWGQCGVAAERGIHLMFPTKIEFDKKVAFVACGGEHSLLIADDGLIYSFGQGHWGQLGHNSKVEKRTPTLIEGLKDKQMKICAASVMHSICIDKRGVVWGFGDNSGGECGLPLNVETQLTPRVIEYFVSNNIKAKDCVANCAQSAVISEDGHLYVFGHNDKNQLCSKGVQSISVPMKLSLPQELSVKKVAMGRDYTAVIAE